MTAAPHTWWRLVPERLHTRNGVGTLLAGALGLLAAALRLFHLNSAYDIFIDEISYLRISDSVAHHGTLTLYGGPFYLHPPGFFLIEGAFLKMAQPHGDTIAQVLAVRQINVLFAMLTAIAVFAIGSVVAGRAAGAIAATLFAVDPFLIQISSWNLLEPMTVLLVMVGLLTMLGAIRRGEVSRRAAVGTGLAFGCALLTKETAAFITLVPCLVWFVTGWDIPRRCSLTVAITATAVYAVYPMVLILTGNGGAWLSEKAHEVGRLMGRFQETGFNKPGTTSLWTAVQHNIGILGTSYFLFLFGGMATLVLLITRRPGHRFLAAVMLSAQALLFYAIVFGTIEEQMFYLLAVPSVVAIGVAATTVIELLASRRNLSRTVAAGLAIAGAGYIGLSCVVWARIHSTSDTAAMDVTHWVDSALPDRARISVTFEPPEFLISGHAVGKWVTPAAIMSNRVGYVMISTKEIDGGYSFAHQDFSTWVAGHGHIVWDVSDRTYGTVLVYALDAPS